MIKASPTDPDGVIWGEVVNNSVENLKIAIFDADAWDVANLTETRVQGDFVEDSAVIGYYRNERDTGAKIIEAPFSGGL